MLKQRQFAVFLLILLCSREPGHLLPRAQAVPTEAAEQQLPPLDAQWLQQPHSAAAEHRPSANAAAGGPYNIDLIVKRGDRSPPLPQQQQQQRAAQRHQQLLRQAGVAPRGSDKQLQQLQQQQPQQEQQNVQEQLQLLVQQQKQLEQLVQKQQRLWQSDQQQQQRQQKQRQQQQQQQEEEEDAAYKWAKPPPPPPYALQESEGQCTEYVMPPHSVTPAPGNKSSAAAQHAGAEGTGAQTAAAVAAAAAAASGPAGGKAGAAPALPPEPTTAAAAALLEPGTAVARRRLAQLAPKFCGKLGTYIPNYYSNVDGSMFGLSIAPNADASVIAVGSPIHGPDAKQPGGASVLTSWSDKTCEYAVVPIWQPEGCYKYFGAQVALSTDGTTMVVMDGVEGIKTPTAEGNRPVVHVYRRYTNGTFVYMQKLPVAPRRAMAAAMAVSITDDAQTILVSFSVGEGFPDKRGSAQLFVLDGTQATARYNYLQDLANLNMPAGTSVQFGQTSVISNNGIFIAVGTAANNNALFSLVYMYKKDMVTGRFRIVSSISSGEANVDPSPVCSNVGLSESNALAMSQSGQFVLKVESAMLVIYEWSGKGMTVTWKRRCQLQAPDGYTFRTTAGGLSIVEVGPKRVKFAAGAYVGTLEAPEQMAVFLYYLDVTRPGSCPYRPAEKHVHNDAMSNYGAGVALSLDGRLLIVGAPTAWDNNMDCQSGAVYLIDVDEVADDGLEAKIITQATNTNAGCVNGMDPNGNPCVTKQKRDPICKDVKLKDGRVIHYGAPGCSPTPPLTSQFWTASLPGPAQPAAVAHAPFSTSSLSAYTTVAPSIKGGVGVPVGSDTWLANQAKAAAQASYFGVPTGAITKPRESIVSAAGWQSSVQPALGGLKSHLNTVGSATAAPPGISALSLLSSGIGALLNRGQGGPGNLGASGAGIGRSIGIGAPVGGPVLPAGAVIRNLDVLRQQPTGGLAGIAVPAAVAPAGAPPAPAPAAAS